MRHWAFNLHRIGSLTWKNLQVFRTRVLLSVLAIFIGIVSVVSTFTVNDRLSMRVSNELKRAGTNILNISSLDSERPITPREVTAIQKYSPAVQHAVIASRIYSRVSSARKSRFVETNAVSNGYFAIRNYPLQRGRYLMAQDEQTRTAVLGSDLAKSLFGGTNAVGRTIWLGDPGASIAFRVVGVLAGLGRSQFVASSGTLDGAVFVPFSALARYLGQPATGNLLLQARSESLLETASSQVGNLLKPVLRDQIKIQDPREEVKRNRSMIDGIVNSGLAVGLLCLISGGVGIMNVMLVSVAQRRREIGLYKAIGFSNHTILLQFIAESLSICLIGAILGIAVGAPAGMLLSETLLNQPGPVNFASIGLSVAFSLVVGVVFGYLPASRAARLDPVEALKG